MSIISVPMFRIVCDAEGCDRSPQDDSDFWAWADADQPLEEARDADWYVTDDRHLCRTHAPSCAEPTCGLRINGDDEFGDYCEDHAPEGEVQP